MGNDNVGLFYRLRNLDRLLGEGWQENDGKSGELEKQEIYFASPSELNDPMEGFSNIVFKGDKIAWHNFFKHYLICLERMLVVYSFCGEKENFLKLDYMPLHTNLNTFPSPLYKQMFDEIYRDFSLHCKECIDKIATRTTAITRDELSIYLKYYIHSMALLYIHHYHIKNGFKQDDGKNHFAVLENLKIELVKIIDSVERICLENRENSNEIIAILCLFNKNMGDSFFLQDKFMSVAKNQKALVLDFPNFYLQSLEKLIYPEFYVACFLKDANNSSTWGHYADGHKGVCLIFKSLNDKIKLTDFDKQTISMQFQKINYNAEFENINFFENLGRLTLPQLLSWYQNENGEKSPIMSKIFANEDKWREVYWKKAEKRLLTKTNDWKYEKEYRLTITSLISNKLENNQRFFKYSFDDLDGIIFGINTPQNAKEKIIDIVRQKCKDNNRQKFNFYQAYYCETNKNIQYMLLAIDFRI